MPQRARRLQGPDEPAGPVLVRVLRAQGEVKQFTSAAFSWKQETEKAGNLHYLCPLNIFITHLNFIQHRVKLGRPLMNILSVFCSPTKDMRK